MVDIGGVSAGPSDPVRIMGVLNTSPESFYKESVYKTRLQVKDRARAIEDEGGSFVDVGGMSTAPYLDTVVPEGVESARVTAAIGAVRDACNLPISVDTCRSSVARDALEAGATVVNDISGLKYDHNMRVEVERYGASILLGAYGGRTATDRTGRTATKNSEDPVAMTRRLLAESMDIACKTGILPERIAVDPSIGFFRSSAREDGFHTTIDGDWASRDMAVLCNLESFRPDRETPMVISVSNKSFLGRILQQQQPQSQQQRPQQPQQQQPQSLQQQQQPQDTSERLYGSIAAETIAVLHGADIIRTHNVRAAHDAAAIASRCSARPNM